jgi:hypothetical protein
VFSVSWPPPLETNCTTYFRMANVISIFNHILCVWLMVPSCFVNNVLQHKRYPSLSAIGSFHNFSRILS